jgi:hypothetical protein
METIKLEAQVTDDGLLKLELPTGMANRKLEVLIVMHPLMNRKSMNWDGQLGSLIAHTALWQMIPLNVQ